MKPLLLRIPIVALLVSALVAMALHAQERKDATDATGAIRARAEAYAAAFNRGEAEALAGYWSPTGTWTDPNTGEIVTGRDNIRAGFEALFKENKGARLEIDLASVKLLTDDVAIEEGTATVSVPGAAGFRSGYTAILVKMKNTWLLDRVIETTASAPAVAGERPLDEIAWLEGVWVDQSEGSTVFFENEWVANGNFLRRTFTVMVEDRVDITGIEIVGWDAAAKQIRSWVFDSEGSFAELKWSRNEDEPDKWMKKARGTLRSGVNVSAVHVMKRLDDDTYTFESVARVRDGELLPNIDEVTVVRSPAAP